MLRCTKVRTGSSGKVHGNRPAATFHFCSGRLGSEWRSRVSRTVRFTPAMLGAMLKTTGAAPPRHANPAHRSRRKWKPPLINTEKPTTNYNHNLPIPPPPPDDPFDMDDESSSDDESADDLLARINFLKNMNQRNQNTQFHPPPPPPETESSSEGDYGSDLDYPHATPRQHTRAKKPSARDFAKRAQTTQKGKYAQDDSSSDDAELMESRREALSSALSARLSQPDDASDDDMHDEPKTARSRAHQAVMDTRSQQLDPRSQAKFRRAEARHLAEREEEAFIKEWESMDHTPRVQNASIDSNDQQSKSGKFRGIFGFQKKATEDDTNQVEEDPDDPSLGPPFFRDGAKTGYFFKRGNFKSRAFSTL